MAETFAREHDLQIFFTSAQSELNVSEAFNQITRMAVVKETELLRQRGYATNPVGGGRQGL